MRNRILLVFLAGVVIAAGATRAPASEHSRRGRRHHDGDDGKSLGVAVADAEGLGLYRKECGACHLAFPPGLLPAASHRRLLAELDRHFGQNAELDEPVRARLERFLVASAADARTARTSGEGPGAAARDAPVRITELSWFQRKHRRVSDAIAARASVSSRANCAACHPDAARWDFDEHDVRVPSR